jgi:hypothetical protein
LTVTSPVESVSISTRFKIKQVTVQQGAAGGLKIASEEVTPQAVERNVTEEEIVSMFENKVAPFIPKVGGTCVKSAVCLYTVTADNEPLLMTL